MRLNQSYKQFSDNNLLTIKLFLHFTVTFDGQVKEYRKVFTIINTITQLATILSQLNVDFLKKTQTFLENTIIYSVEVFAYENPYYI